MAKCGKCNKTGHNARSCEATATKAAKPVPAAKPAPTDAPSGPFAARIQGLKQAVEAGKAAERELAGYRQLLG